MIIASSARGTSGLALVVITIAAAASPVRTQHDRPTGTLMPEERVERSFQPGETHAYAIELPAQQHARVTVDQRGVDLVLSIDGPDGSRLIDVDLQPYYAYGHESIAIVASTAGSYRVIVRAAQPPRAADSAGAPTDHPGTAASYAIRVHDFRPARPDDVERTAIERLLLDADRVRRQGTRASVTEARRQFDEALTRARALGHRAFEAQALTGLGRIHDRLSEKKEALARFTEALSRYRDHTVADRTREAYVLNFLALVHDHFGDRQQALACLDEALVAARAAPDRRVEGVTLHNLGLIAYNMGDKAKARDFLERGLAIHRDVGNRREEGTAHSMLGTLLDSTGDKTAGLDHLQHGLALWRVIGDAREEAVVLNNIGTVHRSLDHDREATAYFQQALERWRIAGDRSGEAATLHNLAGVYERTGAFQQALDAYAQALPLHRATSFRPGEANTLTSLGRLHAMLGDVDQAVTFYEEALAIHRAVENRASEAATLANLGSAYITFGDPTRALATLTQAVTLRRAIGDRAGEAQTLDIIARAAMALGDTTRAREALDQALVLHRAVKSRRGEAQALALLGRLYLTTDHPGDARAPLGQALTIFREVGDPSGEAATLSAIARVETRYGNFAAARERSQAGLAILESLRTRVSGTDLRSSYFASVADQYELAVDILMRLDAAQPGAGFHAEALHVSERARARVLLETLAAARAIDAHEALTRTQPLTAREIQSQVVDEDTVLVEYALGRSRSVVWIVSTTGIAAYTLPSREQIDAAARTFVNAITRRTPSQSPDVDGTGLSEIILAPIARHLTAKRIAIVADGSLHYVPFAALPLPAAGAGAGASARLLGTAHEIVTLPSATTLAAVRRDVSTRPRAAKTVAVLADPVFTAEDARVTRTRTPAAVGPAAAVSAAAGPAVAGSVARLRDVERSAEESGVMPAAGGLARLIGSRREATAILGLIPASARREALDFEASRATATNAELGGYRIVHFATHALLNSVHPEQSGIVLSLVDRDGTPQDGFLRLRDIYDLRLPVDLVVLSACQTALGKEIRGEGLVGLTRGFMHAGAARVVASLWKVDDRATAALMEAFYAGMAGPAHLSPAEALQAAQRAVASRPRWRAPYYWAGFVLQGEWR